MKSIELTGEQVAVLLEVLRGVALDSEIYRQLYTDIYRQINGGL